MKVEFLPGKIGVAVSGGMDSMTLAHLYLEIGVKPVVINVEHGIRGENSLRDSEFVARFAREHGLSLLQKRVDAVARAAKDGVSLELAARNLRYEFFDELLKDGTVDCVVLAHHADDNAETMLMRIFRGTGIRGLKGITERKGYVRPLLGYTREEIAAWASAKGVAYVEDETNSDDAYTRNFIRNRLLPEIKNRYPDVVASFNRLSASAAEADAFISEFNVKPLPSERGLVLKDIFGKPEIVKKYSVAALLNEMGAVRDVESVHLNAVLSLERRQNNASVDLPFNITAVKHGDSLYFAKREDERFSETLFRPDAEYVFKGFSYRFREAEELAKGRSMSADRVVGCIVRERLPGDLFRRVNGKKKLLSDFLNEKKLTKIEKDAILVLAKGRTVYAVLGLETAEEAKVSDGDRILHIIKEKINP